MPNFNSFTVPELRDIIEVKHLQLPEKGSGKNGNIVKSDLVSLFKFK